MKCSCSPTHYSQILPAWLRGLKTTYYLRALGATSAEESTVGGSRLNAVSPTVVTAPAAAPATDDFATLQAADVPLACTIDDPDCEACQYERA